MRLFAAFVFATCLALPALAQSGNRPFLGRWDITVTSPRGSWPQWMELVEKDGKLNGRIQPRGGAVVNMIAARIEAGHLLVTVSAAGRGPETIWDLTADGDRLAGFQKQGEDTGTKLAAVRAPELKRPMPRAWTNPAPLFNGKDLAGWEPIGSPSNNRWGVTKEGELLNEARGANLRTTRTFDDFKLHLEVNCPEGCNSGIYLRGRYEIQVGTEGGKQPSHEMGAVYGFFAPAIDMPMGSGEWQTFDITLVGRYVTIVRNGKKIHDNQELAGTTGGALDSNEGEPGPFFLQGDHDGGMKYRNITIAVPRN